MAEALDPAAYIYQGFWWNLGKASSKSLTLTLCPTNAIILTNALALFVAMSGGQLWTIIRFSLHQIRASSRSEVFDMTHTQQQIVLRNATTDIATARLMLNLAWASRENAKKAMTTCLTIVILAILNATLFMAAGTFSNTLADAGPEVLSRSPHCGLWNQTYLDAAGFGPNVASEAGFKLSVEFISKQIHNVQSSLEYAHGCYMTEPSQYWDSSCDSFQAPRLNWTTTSNESCPFGAEVCSDVSPTIKLDTGIIDTHNDLGVNALLRDRVGYRRVTTCTVLNDTGHTTDWILQNDTSLQAYANYGASSLEDTDFTYAYSNFADFFTKFTGASTTPYQVNAQVSFPEEATLAVTSVLNEGASTFKPINSITKSDADTVLLFLSYIGKYTGRVEDPWFSANVVTHIDSPHPVVSTQFARDRPISTLGCTEQHQLCASEGKCTPLLGLNQVQDSIANFKLTVNQKVTVDRLMKANVNSVLGWVVQNLAFSTMPLLAINMTATEAHTLSSPVPVNQWQLEVGYWHSVGMAQLQRILSEYGTGQIAAKTQYLVPVTGADAWFCRNIMIKSTVYSSFNVVALAILISFGALILVTSLMIEKVSSWSQKRWQRGAHGRQMWKDHDMLGFQLRRRREGSLYYASGSVPIGQQHIFDQGVQRGISSPAASRYYPSGLPNGMSPTRASSKALSPADHARHFPSPPLHLNPSPVRSTFTADFVFDFGQQRNSPSPPCTGYPIEKPMGEKQLPEVPESKNFYIERGTSQALYVHQASDQWGAKPVDVPPPAQEQVVVQDEKEDENRVPDLPALGPGRWAYYSAHKRRYGPKLTVPTPHITESRPAGLRGHFDSRYEGNWI